MKHKVWKETVFTDNKLGFLKTVKCESSQNKESFKELFKKTLNQFKTICD